MLGAEQYKLLCLPHSLCLRRAALAEKEAALEVAQHALQSSQEQVATLAGKFDKSIARLEADRQALEAEEAAQAAEESSWQADEERIVSAQAEANVKEQKLKEQVPSETLPENKPEPPILGWTKTSCKIVLYSIIKELLHERSMNLAYVCHRRQQQPGKLRRCWRMLRTWTTHVLRRRAAGPSLTVCTERTRRQRRFCRCAFYTGSC